MISMDRNYPTLNLTRFHIGLRPFIFLVFFFFAGCTALFAQGQRSTGLPASDLGRENFSRVAASATEIKAVLLKEPGILVEVKGWVAKDATDHGQVISDSDLTNDAIFERLESDSQFRSIATTIVQKYGYLVPRVNPDSDLAKEHDLLIAERTKWLAQHQEEELALARQRNAQNLQNANTCDRQDETNCESPRSTSPSNPGSPQQMQNPGTQSNPTESPYPFNPPYFPRGEEMPSAQGRLMQTGGDNWNNSPLSPMDQAGDRLSGSQSGSYQSFSGSGLGSGGSLSSSGSAGSLQQMFSSGDDGQSDSRFSLAKGMSEAGECPVLEEDLDWTSGLRDSEEWICTPAESRRRTRQRL